MTTRTYPCRVYWTPREHGGRDEPFAGVWYSTSAKFPEQTNWQVDGWSVVLEFETPPSEQGSPSIGKVSFLVDEAPDEWLFPGQIFEMYEGKRMTAKVEVTV